MTSTRHSACQANRGPYHQRLEEQQQTVIDPTVLMGLRRRLLPSWQRPGSGPVCRRGKTLRRQRGLQAVHRSTLKKQAGRRSSHCFAGPLACTTEGSRCGGHASAPARSYAHDYFSMQCTKTAWSNLGYLKLPHIYPRLQRTYYNFNTELTLVGNPANAFPSFPGGVTSQRPIATSVPQLSLPILSPLRPLPQST